MKKGFTLAEVLITLGVIGVVAALTMPNLLQNHQKKVFVTQLQRTVNLVSNSATQLMSDENAPTLADTYLVPVDEDYKNAQGRFMNQYFKVARDCGTDNRAACLGDLYYSLDRSESFNLNDNLASDYYCVTINTGATVCMDSMWADEVDSGNDSSGNPYKYVYHGHSDVVLDVNGPSGPNTNGRDLFQFELYSDGKIGNGWEPTNSAASTDCTSEWGKTTPQYGAGHCFQHIQANGWVMDY